MDEKRVQTTVREVISRLEIIEEKGKKNVNNEWEVLFGSVAPPGVFDIFGNILFSAKNIKIIEIVEPVSEDAELLLRKNLNEYLTIIVSKNLEAFNNSIIIGIIFKELLKYNLQIQRIESKDIENYYLYFLTQIDKFQIKLKIADPSYTTYSKDPFDRYQVKFKSKNNSVFMSSLTSVFNSNQDLFYLYTNIKRKLEERFSFSDKVYRNLWGISDKNVFPKGNWIVNSGSTEEHEERVIELFKSSIEKAVKSLDIFILGAISNKFSTIIKAHLDSIKNHKNDFVLRIFSGVEPSKINSSDILLSNLLSKTFKEVKVVLYNVWGGSWENSNTEEERVLEQLPSNIRFVVGAGLLEWNFSRDTTPFNFGWDHCKIIVIDGQETIFGGMNFTAHSLNPANDSDLKEKKETREDTVHDLALRVQGQVAINAQNFINAHWERLQNETALDENKDITKNFGKNNNLLATNFKAKSTTGGYYFSLLNTGKIEDAFTPFQTNSLSDINETVNCITVGRRSGSEYGSEPSDIALIELISSAESTLYISQQALFYPYNTVSKSWTTVIDAIAVVLKRGVNVDILLSRPNDKNAGDDGGYSSAESCLVRKEILRRIVPALEETGKQNLLRVYNLKNKDKKFARNHAKAIIVDKMAAYIGSQNLYPNIGEWLKSMGEAKLGEFGVIIFDRTKVEELVNDYWNPLWEQSEGRNPCDDGNLHYGISKE